ncbi:MAG: hypothetical protein ACYDCK_15210, partial [Thermoplasmatota archaeon]
AAFADYSLGGLGSGCMSGLLSPPCSNQAPSAHDGSAARAFGLTVAGLALMGIASSVSAWWRPRFAGAVAGCCGLAGIVLPAFASGGSKLGEVPLYEGAFFAVAAAGAAFLASSREAYSSSRKQTTR